MSCITFFPQWYSSLDVKRAICNVFKWDNKTCQTGAYEKNKGFDIGSGSGTTFIDESETKKYGVNLKCSQ